MQDGKGDGKKWCLKFPQTDAGALTGHWGDGLPADVAAFAISSFAPSDDGDSDVNFQQKFGELLASATGNSKKQLMIDLRGNGGGSVPLCIDRMVQLFPDTTPDTKSNMRASGAMQAIIDYFSEHIILRDIGTLKQVKIRMKSPSKN
jgi:hypothetical protein